MKLITVHMPQLYLTAMKSLVDEKYYPNRAELIRAAVRDLLSRECWGRRHVRN